jgi:diketogulonate reductase-like aldo/keto reductase
MAYSPLAQAGRLKNGLMQSTALLEVSRRRDAQPGQILLAFAMRDKDMIAFPKAVSAAHVLQNAAAAEIELTDSDMALLSEAFPTPAGKMPLDMS